MAKVLEVGSWVKEPVRDGRAYVARHPSRSTKATAGSIRAGLLQRNEVALVGHAQPEIPGSSRPSGTPYRPPRKADQVISRRLLSWVLPKTLYFAAWTNSASCFGSRPVLKIPLLSGRLLNHRRL
jgi:hypothetical protein